MREVKLNENEFWDKKIILNLELLPRKRFKIAQIYAIIVLLGLIGLYWFISRILLSIFLGVSAVDYIQIVNSIIRLTIIISFLILFRGNLNKFLISFNFSKVPVSRLEIILLIVGILSIILFSMGYALYRVGYFAFMPIQEYFTTIPSALYYGIVEEIEFRGILLVFFMKWFNSLINRKESKNNIKAVYYIVIILSAILFGPFYHNRYILSGEWILVITVTIFGLFAILTTLKLKTIRLAIIIHVLLDFIPFIFFRGAITKL
ncbi:MAG: CPBP family glutamic-type intramembrane protease [Promethearchaeota archaeon]